MTCSMVDDEVERVDFVACSLLRHHGSHHSDTDSDGGTGSWLA
jgi:hypothetical protein